MSPAEYVYLLVPLNKFLVRITYVASKDMITSITLTPLEELAVIYDIGIRGFDEIAVKGHSVSSYTTLFPNEEELLIRNDINKKAFSFFLRSVYNLLVKEKANISRQLLLSRKLSSLLKKYFLYK